MRFISLCVFVMGKTLLMYDGSADKKDNSGIVNFGPLVLGGSFAGANLIKGPTN